MGTEIALPKGFGSVSSVFSGGSQHDNDDLGAGVAASYAVVGYRGKVWSLKFQGNEMPLMRDDGDGPRNSIEVVILKASPNISKIYYKSGYVEGSNASPDCWSATGVTPDVSVLNKVHPTCADCPMNVWGSKISEAGKQVKACVDSRRLAVVPVADIENDRFGGPMLLRVPAASLKDLKAYGDLLNSFQVPYYAAVTKISFDSVEAFPKFVFVAPRALDEDEAEMVRAMKADKRVGTVLQEVQEVAPAGKSGDDPSVPSSPFGHAVGGKVEEDEPEEPKETKAKETKAKETKAKETKPPADPFSAGSKANKEPDSPEEPKAKAKAKAKAEEPEAEEDEAAPGGFDDLLDELLGN